MNNNPFVLPGFGQSGPAGQNPILASMEMMRQAWEGLASSGGVDPSAMGMMSVEEMDKRISDLRAVENWLRMNLSMLSSTIQGLEVQRATVATLKSFVDTGMASVAQSAAGSAAAPGDQPRPASPLEEVLKQWPGPGGDAAPTGAPGEQAPADAAPGVAPDQPDIVAAASSAAQGWWNLLQQQFQTLAAATAAGAEGPAVAKQAARKTTSKTAARSAAKKTAGKKTAAKKTTKAAKKTTSARKTAR